jgi:hypothetical protein
MGLTRFATMVFLLAAAGADARCGPSRRGNPAISAPQPITLTASSRGVFTAAAFYLHVSGSGRRLVLFFKPDDVVDALQKLRDSGLDDAGVLLSAIQPELPLRGDRDLFQYMMRSYNLWSARESLVTELLRSGRAALAQAGAAGDFTNPDRGDIRSIVMVTESGDDKFWFCTQDGAELHEDIRVIE